jgi:hypothetical protein
MSANTIFAGPGVLGGNSETFVNAKDEQAGLTGQFNITGPYGGTLTIQVDFVNDGVVNTYGHLYSFEGRISGDGEWY